jgi:sulfite exporter TauE/SafE
MLTVLALGFLLGIKHALEADHVAAVASLATRAASLRETVSLATAWGLGHTATLALVGMAVIGLEMSVSARLAGIFEVAVGVMLIVLGADVLRRVRARRVHFHVHQHDDGMRHFHAHAHAPELEHDPVHHAHEHPSGLFSRALVVGGVHGLAGSAALIVLSLQMIHSVVRALAYLLIFGVGTILGMVLFSLAIALPLFHSRRLPQWAAAGVEAALGVASIVLGIWITASAL